MQLADAGAPTNDRMMAIGVWYFVVAGGLLVYLLRPEVRAAFTSANAPS
jgi:hypothetical protein